MKPGIDPLTRPPRVSKMSLDDPESAMLPALTLLLVFQLIGEAAGLPRPAGPGPVIGWHCCSGWLILRGGPSADLRGTTGGLLQHLSLLFVPAGTGVMLHVGRIGRSGCRSWCPWS